MQEGGGGGPGGGGGGGAGGRPPPPPRVGGGGGGGATGWPAAVLLTLPFFGGDTSRAGPVHSCVGAAGRFAAVCCVRGVCVCVSRNRFIIYSDTVLFRSATLSRPARPKWALPADVDGTQRQRKHHARLWRRLLLTRDSFVHSGIVHWSILLFAFDTSVNVPPHPPGLGKQES